MIKNLITLLTALKKKVDAGKIKDRKINEALDHIRNNCEKRFVTGEITDNFKIEVSGNIYSNLMLVLPQSYALYML